MSSKASGWASTSLNPAAGVAERSSRLGCFDDPGGRLEQDAVWCRVSRHGRVKRVAGPLAAGIIEALEHPAHEAEHEAMTVVGIVPEPHACGRCLELDIDKPCVTEQRADAGGVGQRE